MGKVSLGLAMIVRDEEKNLTRSLAPVAALFDEVVVLDTGSRDGTPHLAAKLGAKVYHSEWTDDFSQARNRSLELATADWLLWLDADNAIAPQDVASLRQAIPAQGPAILWAREKLEPSGEILWQKRCFTRRFEAAFVGRVHEQLVHPADWPQVLTEVVIRHWGYADPKRNKTKSEYYLGLLELTLEENPADFYSRWQAARCLSDQRRFQEAGQHFAMVAQDQFARTVNRQIWLQGWLGWARCLERLGKPLQALSILKQSVDEAPLDGQAHLAYGRQAYKLGRWPQAQTHLEKALELGMGLPLLDLDPQRGLFQAAYYLAQTRRRLGDMPGAAEAMTQAVEYAPDNSSARAELAALLWDLGQRDTARDQLKLLLHAHPLNRQARHLLASWEQAA